MAWRQATSPFKIPTWSGGCQLLENVWRRHFTTWSGGNLLRWSCLPPSHQFDYFHHCTISLYALGASQLRKKVLYFHHFWVLPTFWTVPGLGLGSIVSSQNISGPVHVCLKQHVPSIDKNISQQWLYAFKVFLSGDPLWAVARVQSSDMTLNLLVDPILDRRAGLLCEDLIFTLFWVKWYAPNALCTVRRF